MDNIYILTFHFTTNYGASLQSYALYKYLKNKKLNVKVVDYRSENMKDRLYWTRALKKGNINALIYSPIIALRKLKFKRFNNKYITFSNRCSSIQDIQDLPSPFAFICGSDQIWNPEITNGLDDAYFANFESPAIKVAYAGSVGKDEISDDLAVDLVDRVDQMNYIGIREKYLQNKLYSHGYKNITHVLDPTFLISKSCYQQILKPTKQNNYVLIYAMSNTEKCIEIGKYIAKIHNLKTILVKGIKKKGVDDVAMSPSPEQFLGLIQNADFIITSSFHGLAFSLIFEKQFYCVGSSEGRSSRLVDLLDSTDLYPRLVNNTYDCNKPSINYSNVNVKLNYLKEISQKFLDNALCKETYHSK
ncbi:hypothetical protein IAW_05810 [Bacillus cereus str. Schrouff]|uniref:polysaccharide pyruvyl transferase family protein n=1 Tax=Bacillus cereus TaxID=1396 RepID=UPI000331262F|nr:polysaccharide pyruvyl transferase family protein [Bacillus cereus]EOO04992.1 hypothetical protein IAW_05810 [Bacillus cereus str. Schrouff]EOO81674.1 hypothetical protein IGY_05696 [Bacillus cereus K-5975c]